MLTTLTWSLDLVRLLYSKVVVSKPDRAFDTVDVAISGSTAPNSAGITIAGCGGLNLTTDLRRACGNVDRARQVRVGGVYLHTENFGW